MRPNIGYFPFRLLSETLDLASSHIFQNVLQGGDFMSHRGHGDEPSRARTKVLEALCCDISL